MLIAASAARSARLPVIAPVAPQSLSIENENQLGGERITLFMRSDRSIVERGNVLFYQEKIDSGKTDKALRKSK